MKRGSIYLLITVLVVFVSGCGAKMQTYDINQEYATTLHYQGTENDVQEEEQEEQNDLVGVPARSFYGGDLKRGAIWWAGKNLTLEKGDVFLITATNVGPDTTPFGATFPPLDLTKEEVVIKISARAESVNGDVPALYLQVDDADGYQANAARPVNKIENSEEFKDYYYDLKGMFNQITPKKHKVNAALINSVKLFINPGGSGYTGKIYIREVRIVPVSSVPK
ncbi:MAG: hypothetical protein ACJ75J_10745 [Cytophagaceae bacterium]